MSSVTGSTIDNPKEFSRSPKEFYSTKTQMKRNTLTGSANFLGVSPPRPYLKTHETHHLSQDKFSEAKIIRKKLPRKPIQE